MRRSHALLPIATPLAALALTACGSSRPAHTVAAPGGAGTAATGSHASASGPTWSADHRASGRRPGDETGTNAAALTPNQFSEGGGPVGGDQTRSTAAHHRLPSSPRPGTRKGRGTYVGPDNDGQTPCGYQYVGPGLEQAEAFAVHGTSCRAAKALAVGARGHTRNGRHYASHGFGCVVSVDSRKALARYSCTQGPATVTFVVS